jgi:hypothetical protein
LLELGTPEEQTAGRTIVEIASRPTASDQGDRRQPADLALTVSSPGSMISFCGSPTRVPGPRPRAELADAARPVRRSQGRRDPGLASRGGGCRAAPTQPAPEVELGRPRAAQYAEPAPADRSAPAVAGVTENTAALALPPGGPPLELSATTTRTPNHVANGSRAGVADGPGEPTDRVLIFGERHLRTFLAQYGAHYNGGRPHRALSLLPPRPDHPAPDLDHRRIRRRSVLGGLINEYERAA